MAENLPRPTDAELEILTVLWSRGPTTVREVHEAICTAQAHAIHHRAEDAADHGGEGPGAPRREAARARLRGRAAARMDAAATGGRPAAARLRRVGRAACCWARSPPARPRRRNWPNCASCSTNTKRGRDERCSKSGYRLRWRPRSAGRCSLACGKARWWRWRWRRRSCAHAGRRAPATPRPAGDARDAGGLRLHFRLA